MRQLWQALMMVRRCDRRSFGLRVLYTLLQSLLPLVNLYVLKRLIDGFELCYQGGANLNEFVVPLVAYTLVFLANRIVSALNGVNTDVLGQRLVDYMADLMQRQAARLDMAYFDTPEYHDTYHRAQQEASSRPMAILGNFMSLFGSALSILGVTLMLLTVPRGGVVLAALVLAAVPAFLVRLYKARKIYAFRRENTQRYRQTAYYNSLLTSREAAKEVRAFELTPTFRTRFVESRRRLVGKLLGISRRMGRLDMLSGVVEAGAVLLMLFILGGAAAGHWISVGTFVMLFEAFRRGQGYMQGLVAGVAGLYDNRLFVGNLFEFLQLEPSVQSPSNPVPTPAPIEQVELRDVTFRYPDMSRNVLEHFSLTARHGTVTRLEGRNGFGKSTMIKLLLRFYDPDEGSVLFNGTDLRQLELSSLRRQVGAIFQDFVRYQCTVAENIAFGRAGEPVDMDRVREAAHRAGADDIIARLPDGYQTMLGRIFDGGAELSMGQWQRIALARLFYCDAPVMLLDEPMAWMDVATRERFLATLETLKHDHIIIMISHA